MAGFFSKLKAKAERKELGKDASGVRMIVGLGNPGKEYERTRHNVGFDVVDVFARQYGIEVKKKKFGGIVGDGLVGETKVLVVKPQKYMNLSGQVVATAVGFYRLPIDNIIVVTDDMALEPGRIRLRAKGSAGGHNGLSDIANKLSSQDYARLRVGIGRSEYIIGRDYVLGRPTADEKDLIDEAVARSKEALFCWVNEGIEPAMNKYNVR
ncbi:MAG: aminoacyl-tRNA hydrolase [Planctomycetes bacterium]|nr:aminoacyl-tRNA hydrolase [Planctomycetota bacterium]